VLLSLERREAAKVPAMAVLLNRASPVARTLVLLALSSFPLQGCSAFGPAIERPEVVLMNLRPLESTLFEQRVETELRIRNPNDMELDITGLDVEISLNGMRLARVLSNEAVKVPRFGEATIKAVASTSATTILRQIAALQKTGGEDPSYGLRGHVYLGSGFRRRVKLEHSGKLLQE
jgi:LEA14-like dessication related protein